MCQRSDLQPRAQPKKLKPPLKCNRLQNPNQDKRKKRHQQKCNHLQKPSQNKCRKHYQKSPTLRENQFLRRPKRQRNPHM